MAQDALAEQRRRLIFVYAACQGAVDRLDADELAELGLITRLQEIIAMIEGDLARLAASN